MLVHFNPSRYENAADEIDRLLGLKRAGLRSLAYQMGRYREVAKKTPGEISA
ncbi:MAG: hypothetical protein ACLUE8_01395 [Lachnospiraceae bacterium]